MLLTEWVSFKEEQNQRPQERPTSSAAITGPAAGITAQDNTFVPDAEFLNTDNSTSLDTEDVPVIRSDATATTLAESSNSPRGSISISTDVLRVVLDPVGGDIVSVSLPTHAAELDQPDVPFQLLERSDYRQYYAQSGLIGVNGTDSSKGRPTFTSSSNDYVLREGSDELTVDLDFTQDGGAQITKRFEFRRGDFLVDQTYLIDNRTNETWRANLFAQIKRDDSPDPAAASNGMGMVPYLGGALTEPDKRFRKISFSDMEDEPYKASLPGGWISIVQHYFLSAWIPNPNQSHDYSTSVTRNGDYIIRFTSPETQVAAHTQGEIRSQFYAGPKDQYRLKDISAGLDLSVDYGWLWWIAKPLFWLLTNIHGIFNNWGVAIILLTVLVKAVFFPLSAASFRSMANMRRVQPKIVDLRERYADDKQKQSQAMMELYKKEKINPLGGCLPILIQMPVFISLYWVLMESVELRHAPFALWINDLSVMDPYFVLPLIMGASMFFQQRLNPAPPDPMQAKIMQWMPIVFTFFFLFFPSGLVLYWVVNNLLSITQQWFVTKQIENSHQ